MRLLIIEQDSAFASDVCHRFSQLGFVVDQVSTLDAAEKRASSVQYDAIITERILTDGDSLFWVADLRRNGNMIPVLITTAESGAVEQRIEGLNAGADECVSKSIPLDELVARVRAVMRRSSTALKPILEIGNVFFNTAHREVSVAGNAVRMPRRESSLLEMLMRDAGKIVSTHALNEGLYNFEADVSSNVIAVSVYRLRTYLLEAGATATVRTARGKGYLIEKTS